jgi:hypothetical protein
MKACRNLICAQEAESAWRNPCLEGKTKYTLKKKNQKGLHVFYAANQ